MTTDSPNDPLSRLMKKAKLEMPFSDFEETVMQRIQKEMLHTKMPMRDRKLSFVFFLLGTVLGLIINSFLQKVQFTFLDISSGTITLLFQLGFVLLFLIQFEKNLHFLTDRKSQRS